MTVDKATDKLFVELVAMTAAILLVVANWFATLTYGFGLEVQSWWALVGFGAVGTVLTQLILKSVIAGAKAK